MNRVMCAGNITEDTVLLLDRLPQNDEVRTAKSAHRCYGGRGVVPALVLRARGMHVTLATVLGLKARATAGRFLVEQGLDIEAIEWQEADPPITQYFALFGRDEHKTSAAVVRPPLSAGDASLAIDRLGSMDAVYFSTNDFSYNLQLLSAARPTDQILMQNLGLDFSQSAEYVETMLDRVHVIVSNDVEYRAFLEATGLGAQDLISRAPALRAVVVTDGPRGVKWWDSNANEHRVPVAVSTTGGTPIGAGDTFAAGMLSELLGGSQMASAISRGTQLARLAVESMKSYPDLDLAARYVYR